MFEKLPKKKKDENIFRGRLIGSPEMCTYVKWLMDHRQFNEWANKAFDFLYNYERHRKGFMTRIIEYNFEACKKLLRFIGRRRKENLEK